ncbi:CD276 antigen-like isoform X2 [Mobula birostris]|uniref:CD276 antigen-like isoform X2 n=1 Tax=Mobula birostris TaxID=1983395 RepID=UPI003B27CEA9
MVKMIFNLIAVLIHHGAGGELDLHVSIPRHHVTPPDLSHPKPDMVPKNVIAIHGQSVVLECSVEAPLEHCFINWQRKETGQVVHSYYYDQVQNERQDSRYAGRTTLFPEEFKNGNASLKLDRVDSLDSGLYQCHTSCNSRHESLLNVTVAAYYDEPVLSIRQKFSSCLLMFESHGLPIADVSWYNGDSLNRSLSAEYVYRTSDDGLYTVQSSMEVDIRGKTNYTFVLRNAALNQTILRTLGCTSDAVQPAEYSQKLSSQTCSICSVLLSEEKVSGSTFFWKG